MLSTAGGTGAGENRSSSDLVGNVAHPRWYFVHLIKFLSRLPMRDAGVVGGRGGEQLSVARVRKYIPAEKARRRTNGVGGGDYEASRYFEVKYYPWSSCDKTLDDQIDSLGGMNGSVQVLCAHGGWEHAQSILEHANRITHGNVNPRHGLAFQQELSLGQRPRHPVERAREVSSIQKRQGRSGRRP